MLSQGHIEAAAKGHQAAVGKVTAVRADATCQPRPNCNPVFGSRQATPNLDTSAASARYTFTRKTGCHHVNQSTFCFLGIRLRVYTAWHVTTITLQVVLCALMVPGEMVHSGV